MTREAPFSARLRQTAAPIPEASSQILFNRLKAPSGNIPREPPVTIPSFPCKGLPLVAAFRFVDAVRR